MPRDTRHSRDLHALTEDGMVLCNPRDREAAHRAEVEGIATDDASAVTCAACLDLLHRQTREGRTRPVAGGPTGRIDGGAPAQPEAFVRNRSLLSASTRSRDGEDHSPRQANLRRLRVAGGRKADHGADRLAQQIFDCLRFSSVLSEEGLSDFGFLGVHPGGRSGHFIVDVASLDPSVIFDPNEVQRMLAGLRSRVRSEVARGVHRRKAPEITFRVLPPGA